MVNDWTAAKECLRAFNKHLSMRSIYFINICLLASHKLYGNESGFITESLYSVSHNLTLFLPLPSIQHYYSKLFKRVVFL